MDLNTLLRRSMIKWFCCLYCVNLFWSCWMYSVLLMIVMPSSLLSAWSLPVVDFSFSSLSVVGFLFLEFSSPPCSSSCPGSSSTAGLFVHSRRGGTNLSNVFMQSALLFCPFFSEGRAYDPNIAMHSLAYLPSGCTLLRSMLGLLLAAAAAAVLVLAAAADVVLVVVVEDLVVVAGAGAATVRVADVDDAVVVVFVAPTIMGPVRCGCGAAAA
mmetsp:Transcript_8242/g.17822  ORF Transcript_8242/g.17822 Transcript_8242/m.17822 type:complete len:213 (+) Transcript_8242:454-1092(+)